MNEFIGILFLGLAVVVLWIISEIIARYCPNEIVKILDKCEWKYDIDTGIYRTECANKYMFFDSTPDVCIFDYCPYCGKNINDVSEEEVTDESGI